MKIQVSKIPEEGMRLDLGKPDKSLEKTIAEAFHLERPDVSSLEGHLDIMRSEGHVHLEGEATLTLNPDCMRCLETFEYPLQAAIKMEMLPLYQSEDERREFKGMESELELTAEDLESSTYKNDEILVGDMVREHLLLALPTTLICTPECLGLCSNCGSNLNLGPCACKLDSQPLS